MLQRQKDYYCRVSNNGTFVNADDTRSENEVAAMVEQICKCQMCRFAPYSPIDWYAVRNGMTAAVLELKTRSHTSTEYPTVYLNLRKWLALALTQAAWNVPGIFVVRFIDGVWFVRLNDITATKLTIAGCVHPRQSPAVSDREPVIEVSITDLRPLKS